VRRSRTPSEITRLVSPVAVVIDAAWQRMHWWIATMAVLYGLSGITVVKPDEVAVVLRWGRLVGDLPALQQHAPGLLFAFPRPIDKVVRVQTRRVREVPVRDLITGTSLESSTLDPLTQGYAITGDHNIVHVEMVARYRVKDPVEWVFYGPESHRVLRAEVTAAMVRSLGEMGVDRVLAGGRKSLIAMATRRAQAGLDAARSGLELSSLELTRLTPPLALASEFDAVQSAFIDAETRKKEAQASAESAIPNAQAQADAGIQSARAEAAAGLAQANGDATAFRALDKEYRANPAVVRERLYRDAVERAIAAGGTVRWVPPPIGGSYRGFRITLRPGTAGPPANSPAASPTSALPASRTGDTDDDDF
jgi:modulator of FtsH protease HflK